RDARQMTTMSNEFDRQFQADAWLPLDERTRAGAGRAARPGGARFPARRPASRTASEVNFVGRGAFEGRVRAVGVVPGSDPMQVAPEGSTQQRDDGRGGTATQTFTITAARESFHRRP